MIMVIVKALIFTILVPGSVTVWIPYLLLSSNGELFAYEIGGFRLIGIFPTALGATFYLWCVWNFAFSGKGTPAPIDPPKILVARGLYQIVRNPMYVGVALILIGETILFASLTLLYYTFIVVLMFHLFVLYYEEPTLKKKFGASYEKYCKAVPRWLPRAKRVKRDNPFL